VFHLELRQFPNIARAFNLSEEDLQRRFLAGWVAGRSIELDDRRWSPEKARLTIYEGRALRPDEIGMGRGWGNVTRTGRNVTDAIVQATQLALAPSAREYTVKELKAEIMERAAGASLSVPDVLVLASERHPQWRLSDRLAVAELVVWELLHQNRIRMLRGEQLIEQEQWGPALLAWQTWAPGAQTPSLVLEPAD
jgi:hypothetical protein